MKEAIHNGQCITLFGYQRQEHALTYFRLSWKNRWVWRRV